jgi:hypothetical protein
MTIVNTILQQMPAVGQPQRKFRETLFATILALRGRGTCRHLSRYCHYSARTLARQFRRGFDWPPFPPRVRPAALDPRSALLSAQETSFSPKSGNPTCGLGQFFTRGANRADRGLEIATLAVVDGTRRCAVTRAGAQTPPGGHAAATTEPAEEETRVEFYQQHLREPRQRLPQRGTYHCVDGYVAKKTYRDAVGALNLPPITKLRSAANWLFLYPGPHPHRRGPQRKYEGKVTCHDRRRFEALGPLEEAPHVHLSTAIVWHVALKRKLRLVVLVTRQDPRKPRYLVWASTDVALAGRKLGEVSGARFQLEVRLRDSHQVTGLTACQARAEAALDFHFNAALAPLTLARAEEGLASSDHSPQVFSLASWQQGHFHDRLLDVFLESVALDPTWVKNHPGDDKLRTYGAIAA